MRETTNGPCIVDGCDRPRRGRGACKTHYDQIVRYGYTWPIGTPPPHRPSSFLDRHGYVVVSAPGHPNANAKGQILEHRLVMSQHLERPLLKGETVHHRNGNRQDNRIENLELWASRHPAGQRVEDLVAFAKEILALYG